MSARSRSWLGVVAIVVAAAGVRMWMNHRVDDAAWDSVRERAASLPPRPTGDRSHAPLRGATRSGEATACWSEAIARGPKEGGDDDPGAWKAPEDPAAAARIARFQPAIDLLAAGAACDRIDVAAFGSPAWAGKGTANAKGTQLTELVAYSIRHELAQRRHEVALQRTADLLTLARDQMQLGLGLHELVGAHNIERCCDAWTDDALIAMPQPLLRELAGVLQRLDDALPPSRATDNECRMTIEVVLRDPHATGLEPQQIAAYVDAVRALPAADAPWRIRERALVAASNHLTSEAHNLAMMECRRRMALARLRLLRMAIAHHLGETIAPLPDPLPDRRGDGMLQITDDNDVLRLSSSNNPGGMFQGDALERLVRKR